LFQKIWRDTEEAADEDTREEGVKKGGRKRVVVDVIVDVCVRIHIKISYISERERERDGGSRSFSVFLCLMR
jgi:hypothetical protein